MVIQENEHRINKENWQALLHELNNLVADDDWINLLLSNLIKSLHPLSDLDTLPDSRKCISTLGIIENDQKLKAHSSNISLTVELLWKATNDIKIRSHV